MSPAKSVLAAAASLLLCSFPFAPPAPGQVVSLDVLARHGYGAVPLKPLGGGGGFARNFLTVNATLNGGYTKALLLDTGDFAPNGALHLTFASVERMKTEPLAGTVQTASTHIVAGTSRTGQADMVRLGNLELRGVPLVFSNFSTGYMRYGGAGAVSASFLKACSAVIDLQNLVLYLRPPSQQRGRMSLSEAMRGMQMTEIAMGDNNMVSVEINGHRGRMFVETGLGFTILTSISAPRLGVKGNPSRWGWQQERGNLEGADRAQLERFKIGDLEMPSTNVLVSRLGTLARGGDLFGSIGMDVLGSHGAVIDCGGGKLYLLNRR